MSVAVIYGAKSTDDKRGSIPTQLDDCRKLAEREGWQIVGEYTDEGFSAYKGNRGPGLASVKEALVKHAPCALVVQHTDRLARGAGDEPGAADHLMELYFWLGRQGVELWTVQSGRVDRIRALLEGERNTEDSKRKSAATRDGLSRRRDRGDPVGAVPIGYVAKDEIIDGKASTTRVIDPTGAATVERIFSLIETGQTPGQVSRTLNAEGALTVRKGHWTTRAVRRVLTNEDYTATTGYPELIGRERWEHVQATLTRLDPAALQARKGGRPAGDDFLLAGIAFCVCGAPMRCRRYRTGTRVYRCRDGMEGIGLCKLAPVRADLAETHILNHLHVFVGSVEKWLQEKAQDRTTEQHQRQALIDRDRTSLARLSTKRERHLSEYRRMVDDGDQLARYALEAIEQIDREQDALTTKISEGEAVLAEWEGPPDMDAALDLYNRIIDLVQGRIRRARGARDLNQALREVLAGLWMEFETDRDRLLVQFALRAEPQIVLLDGQPSMFHSSRLWLPPVRPGQPIASIPDHSPSCRSSRCALRSLRRCDLRL